ncbi:class II fumarate hydratase [Acrocarpospora phusangensis]|uniref:Fumarate hydratase class II n=1 Tax=Acrocarpospora phusangensis TaxID=1070424 RepID=A0A919QGH7_9ACTN|nr:class II fumarate hydratase [Acrocarpospora phusangensis]GIH27456.1 class II fumarate hydratase [Acrocarpospora phusangensis]
MSTRAPQIRDLPIGLRANGTRTESDSLGEIQVPADHYWGAQTQRSLIHFSIGEDRMPKAVYHAYGYVKKAAAIVNGRAGRLPEWLADLICHVCDEIVRGDLDSEFPLYVWQTGSGTQSNMNVNEVISNRAIQLLGGRLGSKDPVHPNDHVNMGQSSNDTFVTAMHIAATMAMERQVLPALVRLRDATADRSREWANTVKIGRTHLEDATPLTVGQEWSGYAAQLDDASDHLKQTMTGLYRLAIGGTAVGTGLNAPPGFGDEVAAQLADLTGLPFTSAPNKFAAQASCDPLVRVSAALRALAVSLFKFANDMRWLGSGPRTGLHELILPSNEPGSSIMPGKVNPTQAEAMLMVAVQVVGNDSAVSMAGAEGNFELNAFRPVIIDNVLRSARLLADMMDHFRTYLIEGAQLNSPKLKSNVERSIMMVTALSPVIGYDRAARIAHRALAENLTLKDAALNCGVPEPLYDKVVNPEHLTRPGVATSGNGAQRRPRRLLGRRRR